MRLVFCAMAMAEHMEGRRELQALAAGVLEPTVDGVICGVGNGPMRMSAGVGGARVGMGSKKRGSTVAGVGVLSDEVETSRMGSRVLFVGVGVSGAVGLAKP